MAGGVSRRPEVFAADLRGKSEVFAAEGEAVPARLSGRSGASGPRCSPPAGQGVCGQGAGQVAGGVPRRPETGWREVFAGKG